MKYVVTVLALLLPAAPAWAAPRNAVMSVKASVRENCVLHAIGELDFGTYSAVNVRGKALKGKAKVLSIACTSGSSGVRIALGNGHHFKDAMRHMLGPKKGVTIAYEIFTNRREKKLWTKTDTVAYVPRTDAPQDITMWGEVPGKQVVPPGGYHDEVTAVVDF